ncbi:MAG: nucleotidyltransferase [Firmicutes bacterium]|nr:nucleotidyltransferase [Bacillota bacterium]
MTLVIMAAGMGSRFGGLKQIEPVHSNGEFILDYSIYDAVLCGFNKVVFIIKEENYEIFRDTIGKRIEDVVEVKYVFQKNDNVPQGVCLPSDRVKPLGTGHAILCCEDVVYEDFLVINADDFYGRDAFKVASEYMNQKHNDNEYALVGYATGNTLTEHGSVKRGICEAKDGYLTKIVESSVEKNLAKIKATPLNGGSEFFVEHDCLVSMNMFIFNPTIFKYLKKGFEEFFADENVDLEKGEFLMPDVVCNLVSENKVSVEIIPTNAVWQGITYKEDKELLVSGINKLVEEGIYPDKLWK